MSPAPAVLFVYNADSGLFNTLADIGHKIFSPQTYNCALCALTHGYLTERTEWRRFIERLPCECRFLHRDEFVRSHPGESTPLPAVFVVRDGSISCCADRQAIVGCADLAALADLIRQRCCPGGPAKGPGERGENA